MDKNTKLLIKSDRYSFQATENTGFVISRKFDSFHIDFTNVFPTHTNEENNVIKDVKLNNNYITLVPKIKKTNNEGQGFVSVNSDGLGFMVTQEMNLLSDFIKTIEDKGIKYVKELKFNFYIRNPEKQKTSLKIIHSFEINYSENVSG